MALADNGASDDGPLWERWRASRDPGARAALVGRYLWLAKAVAVQVLRTRSPHEGLDYRELVQLATVGVMDAIGTYDPVHGVPFPQYAGKRVRGAVLDGIDRHSEYHAQAALRRNLQRERARSLAAGVPASRKKGRLFEEMVETAIGLAIGLMLEDTPMYVDEQRATRDPYHGGELLLLREQLRFIVEGLPEQERIVVCYHYYNELPFSQIAELMQLTKGRISQIHAKAIALIRRRHTEFGSFETSA